jgi:hypothetical protein
VPKFCKLCAVGKSRSVCWLFTLLCSSRAMGSLESPDMSRSRSTQLTILPEVSVTIGNNFMSIRHLCVIPLFKHASRDNRNQWSHSRLFQILGVANLLKCVYILNKSPLFNMCKHFLNYTWNFMMPKIRNGQPCRC